MQATTGLQRLVAQPIGPLVVTILFNQRLVVILGLVDVVQEEVHRLPVLVDDLLVAKLLPNGPRHDDTCIGPTQTHLLVTILSIGSNAREATQLVLAVAHIAHPLVEKLKRIGEERTCLGKYLCVGSPAQTLVTLRAVGRY